MAMPLFFSPFGPLVTTPEDKSGLSWLPLAKSGANHVTLSFFYLFTRPDPRLISLTRAPTYKPPCNLE